MKAVHRICTYFYEQGLVVTGDHGAPDTFYGEPFEEVDGWPGGYSEIGAVCTAQALEYLKVILPNVLDVISPTRVSLLGLIITSEELPLREPITIDQTLALLNELLALDPAGVRALMEHRVPTTEAVANHPTVQVHVREGQPSVGLLGILNGLFGVDDRGWGPISAIVEKDGSYTRFERTPPQKGP